MPPLLIPFRLLGHVVDHIDALIDEWYPGLYEMTPLGDALVQIKVPCPFCKGSNHHSFLLDDLITQSDLGDTIHCPEHDGVVQLQLLVSESDTEVHQLITPCVYSIFLCLRDKSTCLVRPSISMNYNNLFYSLMHHYSMMCI